MPPRDRQFGPDTVAVACYLSSGPGDPGLEAWKRDHPDWFEAGTWTPGPRAPATERRQRQRDALSTLGRSKERPFLDPATISVADFEAVRAESFTTRRFSARGLKPSPDPPIPDAPG